MTIHATGVAIGGRGVLLVGRSGSGKSDLALRLIDRGAVLIGDDRVALAAEGGRVIARGAAAIAGRIEVRGVGIADTPAVEEAAVALVVLLDEPPERLPEPRTHDLCGVAVPAVALRPFEASAALKVERALTMHGLRLEPAASP